VKGNNTASGWKGRSVFEHASSRVDGRDVGKDVHGRCNCMFTSATNLLKITYVMME